jgi:hypothetical protein
MENMEEEAQILHKEWRTIVLNKLDSLETQVQTVKNDVVFVKMHAITFEHYEKLDARIKALEDIKTKALAIWAAIQVTSVVIAWFVSILINK